MGTVKKLGIFMDHASATVMEYSAGLVKANTIESKFTHQVKVDSIGKSESLMHNKQQHEQKEFYRQLEDTIRNYDNVLLFGATDAKAELYNLLRADHRFEKINIEVKTTDEMSGDQQYAFVMEHFSRQQPWAKL